jgi:hypothetical protein
VTAPSLQRASEVRGADQVGQGPDSGLPPPARPRLLQGDPAVLARVLLPGDGKTKILKLRKSSVISCQRSRWRSWPASSPKNARKLKFKFKILDSKLLKVFCYCLSPVQRRRIRIGWESRGKAMLQVRLDALLFSAVGIWRCVPNLVFYLMILADMAVQTSQNSLSPHSVSV